MTNKKEKKDNKNRKIKIDLNKWWNNNFKPLIFLMIISLVVASLYPLFSHPEKYEDSDVSISKMQENYKLWLYSSINIDWLKAKAIINPKNEEETNDRINWTVKIPREITFLPNNDSLTELGFTNPDIKTEIIVKDKSWDEFWADLLPSIIIFILFIVIAVMLIGRMWGMANNAMSFGKSRAKLYDKEKDKVTFKDVAWAAEEKEELTEVVDFLKFPKKYRNMWAKIPKWILLVWPPGTGKTLLARAVAGESKVPFISISWSEFVEMFVWVWASRVRDLFEKAKKMSPSIIFIDEIDAIGKKRWPGLGGWHDEREQTLNQILTEMDWFDQDTNVIVMAATNRADVLDKALLRPGRFDRKVTINLPTLEDRIKILEVHTKNKKLSEDVELRTIASTTVWFSGADLWNLINESAILTARKNQKKISAKNIREAFEKIVMWLTKKSQIMTDEEKKITAYHEVWHALVWKLLPNTDPVEKVSIVSRWWALWVTWFLPEKDKLLVSKAKYLDEITTLYGWRVAEEIFFWKENITTWASNDIQRATSIAREMITRFGMDEELWAENFANDRIDWNYLWAEWNSKNFSEKTQELIDQRVKTILKERYSEAHKLITENKDLHVRISEDLLKKEELDKKEFNSYFENI